MDIVPGSSTILGATDRERQRTAPRPEEHALDLLDIVTAPWDAFNWVLDQAFLAMKALFDRFGAPMVFVAALAEATVGVGVVFPGVALIFLGGAFAGERGTPILVILVLAILGTVLGDTISYVLGRLGGSRLGSTRLGPYLRLGETLIQGRARWLIPFYHLNSWTRAVGPFGAGALRLPLRVWMPLDYLGAVIANTAWVGAGYILGQAVLNEDGTLEQHPLLRLGLAAGTMAWFLLVQRELVRSWASARLGGEDASDSGGDTTES